MEYENILAMVVAGNASRGSMAAGKQTEVNSLFGGSYRLEDFVLSNLVNSGISSIYLLAQHHHAPLVSHVQDNWDLFSSGLDGFVHVVQPGQECGARYDGAADAVRKNLVLIERHAPALVAVFSASHIFRMDVRQMVDFHLARNADATVLTVDVPLGQASAFDIVSPGAGGEVLGFHRQGDYPGAFPCSPELVSVSTGNYLFSTEVLVEALQQSLADGGTSFGRHILPRMAHSHDVFEYPLEDNHVPGTSPYEDPAYWREVVTPEGYAAAHRDMAGQSPRFELQNLYWPVLPARFSPPPSFRTGHPISYVPSMQRIAA